MRPTTLGLCLVSQREMPYEAHDADLSALLPVPCACDQRVPHRHGAALSGVQVQVDSNAGGGVPEQCLQFVDGADCDVDLVGGSGRGIHAGPV
jgi:hypothetical protein